MCSDPQCGDSTWDHACDLGEPLGSYEVRFRGVYITVEFGDYLFYDMNDADMPPLVLPQILGNTTQLHEMAQSQHTDQVLADMLSRVADSGKEIRDALLCVGEAIQAFSNTYAEVQNVLRRSNEFKEYQRF